MTKNTQRLSQLVSVFGPGSMVDLPTRSIVVGGLEEWDMKANSFAVISEPRLTERLERLLKEQNRFDASKRLSLRTPPVSDSNETGEPAGVRSPIFPRWFICEQVEAAATPTDRRRRLVRWDDLDPKGRRKFVFDDGRKSDVTPIRFVCACENGHLQDIDWRWVVHGGVACREPMSVDEKGTSADPADTSIVCECNKRLSLQDLFQRGRLGKCRGERPWLTDRDPDECGQDLKLLTRTATNTYFPQVYTIISLPSEDDELSKLVHKLSGEMTGVGSAADVGLAKKFNANIAASLGKYADGDIFDRLHRLREGVQVSSDRSPKVAEFDVFASGRAEIGHNNSEAKLYAQTVPPQVWAGGNGSSGAIKSLVAVHRLREVSCLYGFTRFEAAPGSTDGEIEDVQLAVRGAPIAREADWLPAVEQFGEGIFVHFDNDAIKQWLSRQDVRNREAKLIQGHAHWATRFSGKKPEYPGTPYVLLHSLSHALMQEIALDCGYPASSLKERVYALTSSKGGEFDRCGLLIYTASAGAQGTLGGLVGVVPRFSNILASALKRAEICSNDPICADHEPDNRSGDRATHGAACHGCLLIAETSCESRNLFLDRALLVPTMSEDKIPFFT